MTIGITVGFNNIHRQISTSNFYCYILHPLRSILEKTIKKFDMSIFRRYH